MLKLTKSKIISLVVLLVVIFLVPAFYFGLFNCTNTENFAQVFPKAETTAVQTEGDAADDPSIYYNRKSPEKSLIIGTNKKSGLVIYDLSGKLVNSYNVGKINNCDIQYDITLAADTFDIVGGTNRSDNTISVYKLNMENSSLDTSAVIKINCLTAEVYGFCFYKPVSTKKVYAISVGKDGLIESYEIFADTSNNVLASTLSWKYQMDTQCEGLVCDNENEILYVAEEDKGVWKFDLAGKISKKLIADIGINSNLKDDMEGLTMYYAPNGKGYLIVSSQGNNSYAVFNRDGNNEYLGSFLIAGNNNIDGTSETDGIDVFSYPLNSTFKYGLFIVQDGENIDNGILTTQNFKYVAWEDIAKLFEPQLLINK